MQPLFIVFVDILATAAAFFRMTVRQVSLQLTVSNHRCVKVDRTPGLGLSTCLIFFWCISRPWSIGPFCCFFCWSRCVCIGIVDSVLCMLWC